MMDGLFVFSLDFLIFNYHINCMITIIWRSVFLSFVFCLGMAACLFVEDVLFE